MMAAHSNQWANSPVAQPAMPQEGNGFGLQTRPMGLKVQYTFDKEGKINCLARWQQPLQIQTMPLDDRNTIGVIDLRTCLQAVAQCSPEIVSQQEHDYTVYAMDYSEPDVPLVGQGMLSWGLEQHNGPEPQLVTGRVTRNMMALFGNGNKETLEVKLKLTAVPKIHREESTTGMNRPIDRPNSSMSHQSSHQQQHRRSDSRQTRSFHQPQMDANMEWNSVMQANPILGHTTNITPIPSPMARLDSGPPEPRYPEMQHQHQQMPHQHQHQQHHHRHSYAHPHQHQHQQYPPSGSAPEGFNASFEETQLQMSSLPQQSELPPLPPPSQQTQSQSKQTPLPAQPTSDIFVSEKPKRVRNKGGPPRPRGRPKKQKPADAGNTSGAEMTDADDAPQPKRAKVVQTDYNATAAFQTQPDSLRVAASISGSLRNMRPVGATGSRASASHLQDVPRAPTPVPNGMEQPKRGRVMVPRRPSMADFEMYQQQMEASQSQSQFGFQSMAQQEARSPTESIQSPDPAYTPEESPADIGSSPPVPRTSAFIQSSSAPSSPVLPPADSGFMSGGMDDYLEDDEVGQELPKQNDQEDLPTLPVTKPKRKYTRRAPRRTASQAHQDSDSFQFEEPGPPHLLPQSSNQTSFNGQGVPPSDWAGPTPFVAKGPPPPRALTPRPTRRGTRRDTSTASVQRNPAPVTEHPHTLASFEVAVQSVEMTENNQPSHAHPARPVHLSQQQNVVQSVEAGDNTPAPQSRQPPIEKRQKEESVPAAPLQESTQQLPLDGSAHIDPALQQHDRTEQATIPSGPQDTEMASTSVPDLAHALMPPPSVEPELPTAVPTLSLPPPPKPTTRTLPPVPTSDTVQETSLALPPLPPMSHSEAPCPASDIGETDYRAKKTAVKGRLEQALEKGEMPPFCMNCGAIETPTWRKIWCQERRGVPAYHEYSDKPGMVTTIDILERQPDGQPALYRLVKKSLGKADSKDGWSEQLLCNPCGIWLSKSKGHRPPERWEKDAGRLGAPRRKRERGESKEPRQRTKRVRTKSAGQMNPTSEAYFMTDPAGPGESVGPEERHDYDGDDRSRRQSTVNTEAALDKPQLWHPSHHAHPTMSQSFGATEQSVPGSTHSRGSGTAQSPIALEVEKETLHENMLGTTRRLLFPSPRKDGTPRVLGELAVNVVTTTVDFQQPKWTAGDKENAVPGTPLPADDDDTELDQELFGTPPVRPSTPPPRSAKHGLFKTPTRPTPSHRPITRSVSRSIRSGQKTPTQAALFHAMHHTATPRSHNKMNSPSAVFSMGSKSSRTPRNNNNLNLHAHFAMDMHPGGLDTPFTATLNQLLSEANEFTSGSPSHGLVGMDLGNLPNMDSEDMARQANESSMDFGEFINAEMGLPSSPPMLRGQHHEMDFGSMLDQGMGEDIWAMAGGHEDT